MEKIMIVDDDKFILFATKALLKSENFEVVTVDGGMKCLKELEKGFKGVILMDIMMPQMDGWETIREIINRGLYEGNIIVIFTAMDIHEKKMEDLQEYIEDYITKPFDPDLLVKKIREYFKRSVDSKK